MQLEHTVVKTAPHPFQRTGRPFGGVINDLKHRLPYYLDDFRQALNFQCFTSILYLFFANFASAVAIGDVLGKKTDEWFGVSEILVSHALAGVVWGLFAGQPLCIVAAVGPFMVLEDSIYQVGSLIPIF
uniref:Bicarbonate transporter-like transmembrane domain-containing protein n=1 Tax=Romanomermis culicivorax TaxID=13658 RepID=A0A915K4V2_ROMCU